MGSRGAASADSSLCETGARLVGREAERELLDRLVEKARGGRGAALVVRGESGVGKTALISELTRDARDCLILSARGVEAECQLAYAGLAQLLDPVLKHRTSLPAPRRAALESALGLGPARPGDRFATYAAVLGVLAEAAEHTPVLATVDDAHWLDPASAEALRFCARRVDDDGVCLLFGARDEGPNAFETPEIAELRLPGLDEAASAKLLGLLASMPLAERVTSTLHTATAGNPLALGELVRLLDAEQLAGTRPLPDPLPVGPSMQRAFGSRIAGLPEATQAALLLAATDESGDLDTLVRALRLRGLDAAALEPAETAGLVTLVESRLEFRHPMLRSAAYHRVAAPARREAHATIAAALFPSPRARVRRAWHLAAAAIEPDEDIALELEAAAVDAGQRAAPAAAGRTMEAAARLTSDARERGRRLLLAGRSYHLAGAAEPALGVLDEALGATDDPLLRADVQHARGQVQGLRGAPAVTRALLVTEAALVETHDRGRAVGMLLDAAMASTMLGEPREMLRLAERASVLAAQVGGPLPLLAAVSLGSARILRGDSASGLPLLLQARPLLQGSDLSLCGYVGPALAMSHLWVGNFEDAKKSLVDLVARVRAEGALTALPYGLHVLAFAQYWLGDWASARALASESVAVAEEVGQPTMVGVASCVLALVAAGQGRVADAHADLERVLTVVREFGVASASSAAGWAQGQIGLATGRYDETIEALEQTGRFALAQGLEEPGVIPWAQDLAEAQIRVGETRGAEATLAILEAQAERTGRCLAHAGAARCRGLLAHDGDFERHFEIAFSWHGKVACPFELARTELCYGERLRRSRRRSEAREPLRQALARFETLGAEGWSDRARREIAATGLRARKRDPSTADQLTPQELQVALLVAEGATNKEVASALFVTPKTIEFHLGRIYRKLSIRSRTQLGRRLDRGPSTPTA